MIVTELDQLAERLSTQDSSAFLGRLFWYQLSEVRISHGDLIAAMARAGITRNLPKPPHDTDVFKRVCTKAQRKRVPTSDPNTFENYKMVEFKDSKTVTRRIVCEQVDNKGKVLRHFEMADIEFERPIAGGKSNIDINRTNAHPSPDQCGIAEAIIDEVQTQFAEWKGCMNTYAVREWVRHFLLDLGATKARDGVYFVAEAHAPKLERLEEFANLLAGNGDVDFHTLPLVDDRKQRLMIQRAFEAETIDAIDALLVEISDLAGSEKGVKSARYAELVTEFQELTAKTLDYESLLQDKLDSTGARLKVFKQSLVNLRLRVNDE